MIRNFIAVLFILMTSGVYAQGIFKGYEHLFTPPEHYTVFKATGPIKLDGKADEQDWKNAQWSKSFVDIEGDLKPKPLLDTKMKMLWDDKYLYVFAHMKESDIWAYYLKNDMIVYHENDFEIFIDPDRDGRNYFEFEVNAQNTLFDLFLTLPYRDMGSALIPWDANGTESAVSMDGTINNPDDKDKEWSVEMKIPFDQITTSFDPKAPSDGDVWKINFSRVEWQTNIVDGKYVHKKDPDTGKDLPEYNWVWSPQGVINMHYPERWGNLQFSTLAPSQSKKVSEITLKEDAIVQYLWLIYYKQQDYNKENERYAHSLKDINIPENVTYEYKGKKKRATLNLVATDYSFYASIKNEDGKVFSITEKGWLNK